MMHEPEDAGIHDAVMDMRPVPPRGEDAQIHQPPQLVGHGLGLHAHRLGQVAHAGVALEDQGVQQAQTRFRSQYLEDACSSEANATPSSGRSARGALGEQVGTLRGGFAIGRVLHEFM